jgi:nucleoside-diphosphate-sugar epimerase
MGLAFVTGGNGYVGSNLVEHLIREGWRVRCLVRQGSSVDALKQAGADLVIGDVENPDDLRSVMDGVDVVYHVAGLTAARSYERLLAVNRDGTQNVVGAAAMQPKPPTVVVVSSVAAGGPAKRGQIRLESDPPHPISQYGESKLAGEEAAMAFAGQVPLTIVRPGIVFGPGDYYGQVTLFGAIKRFRFHPVPGMKNPPLSFIFIDDLSDVLMRAASLGKRVPPPDRPVLGEGIYHAVVPEHPTLAEWGRMVRPMLRRPFAPVIYIPDPVPMLVARFNEALQGMRGKATIFNRDKVREAQVDSWACSAAALERDLHFVPPKPLAVRLKETIEWHKANKQL